MNREKTHLYKKQHQQPIEEETPPHKKVLDRAMIQKGKKQFMNLIRLFL